MKNANDQIVSGDYGVPIEIDTELSDLTGYTLKIVFIDPDGTSVREVTAADGGDGDVGKLVTYTTVEADSTAGVHIKAGRWKHVPELTKSGVKRRGSPPVYATVVPIGE